MPHIHTEPGQIDNTASAFIVRLDGPEPRLVFHLHKALGEWMQFGGHVELMETRWEAVKHEILEESGYDMDQLRLLQPKVRLRHLTGADLHPVPVSQNTHDFNEEHRHTDDEYAFVATEAPRNPPQADESKEIKLFTRAELLALTNIRENVREIGLFVLDVCLQEWEQVPIDSL